jgi:hypothetical protein
MGRVGIFILLALPLAAQKGPDLGVVDRIKTEAFDHSKVMDHLYYLSDIHGPRLTGSPEFDDAAKWAMERLKEYGVANVHEEPWGPFGRSWSAQQWSVEMTEPRYSQLTAAPLAWSAPSQGPVSGELIIAPLRASFRDGPVRYQERMAAYEKEWAGKLRGKIVMLSDPKIPTEQTKPQFSRLTDAELADLAKSPEPAAKLNVKTLEELHWPENPEEEMGKFFSSMPTAVKYKLFDVYDKMTAERGAFFVKEGVVAILQNDDRAHEGMIFAEDAGSYKSKDPLAPPTFVLTAEQYDRIARAVQKKIPVQVRVNLKANVSDKDVNGENIIGEIPGVAKKDEIVMVGAHFDSWHTGTGATDNGAGSAVMIEVMRILKALNLKLDRTVRVGLWSGEEQGHLGSRAYVKEHFADPATMQVKPEHAKLSGYFNLDHGSGKIRGVFLEGNDAIRPLFREWFGPFQDLGVSTITIRNYTGNTDHLSFAAVGLPGFAFIQDPLDYLTITHHSDMDTYDHAIPADLMQAAAVIATCVYEAANAPGMLPRRELPPAEATN